MHPLTDDEVAAWRERFPILRRRVYLINNSLGAMPASVPASLEAYAGLWAGKGVQAWEEDWLPELRRVADTVGRLIGAPSGSVVLHQNVATLTSMVLSALAGRPERNQVVVTDLEWPSHRYLLEGRADLEVVVVPTDGVAVDLNRLLAAVDERTLLVVVSHVIFRSSAIVDVDAVCARARASGAVTLVDGYHAVGHMPVDVTAIDCDFYVGGSVKWLCGGPGVAYLYVRPETALAPTEVGWLGHAEPFAFSDSWEPAPGASAWLGGTPSIPAIYAAREGYAVITEVGPDRVRATSRALTEHLVHGALERGIGVRSPVAWDRRAGAVTLDVGGATEAASRRLVAQGIMVDYRPGAGIRVGPHFFNTTDECTALLDALAS